MKSFALFLAVLLSPAAFGESKKSIAKAVLHLDSYAREHLGIGVKALAVVLRTQQSTFESKSALQESGEWQLLIALRDEGFIEVSMTDKLPDGTSVGEELVSRRLTAKAREVKHAVEKLAY